MVRDIARGNPSRHAQTGRLTTARLAIFTEQRKAIHSGIGERRHILLRDHLLCQHVSEGLSKRHLDHVQRHNLGQDTFKGFFYTNHIILL